MTHMNKDLRDMWQLMLDAQKAKGFDLTVRDLLGVWGLSSTSAVVHRLKMLVRVGMVTVHLIKKYHVYRAVDSEQPPVHMYPWRLEKD